MPKERILIVEDQEDLLRLLKIIFTDAGYEVDGAMRGAQGLEISRRNPPDLVILDVMLPDIEGFDVGKALRAHPRTRQTPIVFLTARGERADRLRGLGEVQAQYYMVKPFEIDELRVVVERLLTTARRKKNFHPVTNLPTGELVNEQIYGLITAQGWAVTLFQISGFEIFTQVYGAVASEEVLRAITLMLQEVITDHGEGNEFVGHAGDDRLVLIAAPRRARWIRDDLIRRFNAEIDRHYNYKHRSQGYVDVRGRDDQITRVDLMRLSADLLVEFGGSFQGVAEEIQIAAGSGSPQQRVLAFGRAVRRLDQARAALGSERSGPALQLVEEVWKAAISARIATISSARPAEPISSPYIFTIPVDGAALVGRDELFRRIRTLWSRPGRRNSLLIHGHRRMGKTSVAQALALRCRFGDDTRLSYLSLEAVDLSEIGYLYFEIADQLAQLAPEAPPPTPEEFLRASARTTLNRFLRRLPTGGPSRRMILVLDEFERLNTRFGPVVAAETIDFLRGLTQTYAWLALALIGLSDLDDLRRSYRHPLLGWEAIHVSFLSPAEVAQVLTAPADGGDFPLAYSEPALALIAEMTAGQPYLVQVIGDRLVERFNGLLLAEAWDRPAVFEANDVRAVVRHPDFYAAADAYFSGVWTQFAADQPILKALAPHSEGVDLETLRRLLPASPIDESISRLCRHEIVALRGDLAHFAVPLMRLWASESADGAVETKATS